jgi:hypothetical protein
MSFMLQVVQGEPEGERLVFPPGDYLVGRASDCHVRLKSAWVSRHQCLLHVGDDALFVRDLGSRNGTLVNGRPVLGDRLLVPGDRLQVGTIVLEVQPGGSGRRCPNCGLAYRGGNAIPGPCPGCQARTGLALGRDDPREEPTIHAPV